MEEERMVVVKDWPEPQSVRVIQVFLGFTNFYRRFIQNFSRIGASLSSILRTTNVEALSIQATRNEKNQDAPACGGGGGVAGGSGGGGRSIKNLSTAAKSAKSKKPNFVKPNSGTDFLTPGAKKAFIHLQKAFIEAPILRHFEPEGHIRIETNASEYAIGGILSQMTSNHLDQLTSDHVTHENLNLISSKSKIGQWHLITFFSRKMISTETRYETHD